MEPIASDQTPSENEVTARTSDSFLETIQKLERQFKDLKTTMAELKAYKKEIVQLEKSSNKKKKKQTNKNGNPSGLSKPTLISEQLCEFLGVPKGTEMSRSEVTKRLWAYIDQHDLKNKEMKKKVDLVGDRGEELKSILNADLEKVDKETGETYNVLERDGLGIYTIQMLIKHHFAKMQPKETASAPVTESVKPVVATKKKVTTATKKTKKRSAVTA